MDRPRFLTLNRAGLITGILIYWIVSLVLFAKSEVPLDPNDGISHFQTAYFSWEQPTNLLNHWGKPLFTTLSSPFAQLGFVGMVIFNLSLFSFSAWALYKLALNKGFQAPGLAPFLLMSATVYFQMVVAGMTEILFGTLTIIGLLLYQRKQVIWSAVLISLTIVSRPESVALIPLFGLLLLFKKQYKAIPFLATGFVIFSLAGFLFTDRDLLWLIAEDPYPAASAYGSGSFWHYFEKGDLTLGWFGLIFLPLATLRIALRKAKDTLAVFSLVTLLSIFALHGFLWWQGIKGSMGLVRVMATTTPLMAYLCIYTLQGVFKIRLSKVLISLSLALLIFANVHAIVKSELPVKEGAHLRIQSQAAEYFKTLPWEGRVVYIAPYFAYKAGINPRDESKAWMLWGLHPADPARSLSDGDIIVWDTQFGPREGKIPESAILENPDLKLLESFEHVETNYRIHVAVVQKPSGN